MRRLIFAVAALALVVMTGSEVKAGNYRDGYDSPHFSILPGGGIGSPTIIVGSANGVGNSIGVRNQGGIGNPTVIVNSANGANNSIGVRNRGGVGNPTVIVGSANGAYNNIGVQNRGGVGNPTIIRDSANGAYNNIDVRNKRSRRSPLGSLDQRHFDQGHRGGYGR